MKNLRCFTLLLLATACAHAEDWTTTKKACQDARFFHGFQFHNAEECAVDFFTLDPVGPVVGSVTTGSGFGGGLHFVKQPTANNTFTVKSIYTSNSSFLFGGQYQFDFRAPHPIVSGKKPDGHGGQTDLTKGNLFMLRTSTASVQTARLLVTPSTANTRLGLGSRAIHPSSLSATTLASSASRAKPSTSSRPPEV